MSTQSRSPFETSLHSAASQLVERAAALPVEAGRPQVLRWLLQFSAYMALLVDRFPTDGDTGVTVLLRPTGTPSIGSALRRLLTSIPSGLVLGILWCISGILWLIAAVIVVLGGDMPPSIAGFQRGVLRWSARLVAYHASLVEEYPPFAFETDDGHHTPLAAGGVP